MNEKPITAVEFQDRLAALCRGTDMGFPRKHRDRHIIFRSVIQALRAREPYTERLLNEALKEWITEVGSGIGIDHVTLRRYLVDAAYLIRDPGGTTYQVHPDGRGEVEFDLSVSQVNSVIVVQLARKEAAMRKRERMESK